MIHQKRQKTLLVELTIDTTELLPNSPTACKVKVNSCPLGSPETENGESKTKYSR